MILIPIDERGRKIYNIIENKSIFFSFVIYVGIYFVTVMLQKLSTVCCSCYYS